jgi:UDP-2-acetamido-2-deoxy-ribo-hexuluronate aminotransferase
VDLVSCLFSFCERVDLYSLLLKISTANLLDKNPKVPQNHELEVLMQVPYVDLKAQYLSIKDNINARIQKVLDHNGYINGPEVAEFEAALAKYTGAQNCLAVASGTDALLIPLMAMGVGPGDEVITTPFSFVATAETIVLAGATPVYVDIDPATFNMNADLIKAAITPKTKGIIPVSLYGQTSDMDAINEIAKQHGLWVMEDSAQSFGATYKGRQSCSLSTVAGTSFFPSKPLGGFGDGGAIFSSDPKMTLAMKEIREHGSEKRYYHTRLGVNGRLDTLQCAILLAKLERFPWEVEQRQRLGQRYNEKFSDLKIKDFATPVVMKNQTSVWAQYSLMVPNREPFQKSLSSLGVPTSVHYPMIIPEQPWYKAHANTGKTFPLPHAKRAADHVISLPLFPDMTEAQQDHVIASVKKSLL